MQDQADQANSPILDASAMPHADQFSETSRRGPYTFPPADRIRKKSEYAVVFSNSRKVVDRYFVCYLVTQEQQGSKMGLAVSRKVGKAVTRNRVKRYLREFFRTHRPLMTVPCHFVIVARPAAAAMSYAECVRAMKRLLQRGGVLDG
jgi:ribonuclease P protein component